jgi:hypothetical protein
MLLTRLIRSGIFFLAAVFFLSGGLAGGEEIQVDNLQNSSTGELPEDWKTYPFHKYKAKRVYKVSENAGRRYIQAVDDKDISVPIFKDFDWDIKKYPYLKFRWRAQKIPEGARETHPDTNDSACGVYVGFSRTSALKYVWSAALTPGSYWAKNPGKFSIISKEVGSEHLGRWRDVTVDVTKDYQMTFEKPLGKNPIGIGVMTDGNAVHKPAACDYADFRISSQP